MFDQKNLRRKGTVIEQMYKKPVEKAETINGCFAHPVLLGERKVQQNDISEPFVYACYL